MSHALKTFAVRLNNVDHYLASPGPLDNSTLPRVPVIRIFGGGSTGEKACVHVHQVYPYFYVEYLGKMEPDFGETSSSALHLSTWPKLLPSNSLY
jgi:DNA polymerase zeta